MNKLGPLQEIKEFNSSESDLTVVKNKTEVMKKQRSEENMTASTGFSGSEISASEDIVMEEAQDNSIYNENKELA